MTTKRQPDPPILALWGAASSWWSPLPSSTFILGAVLPSPTATTTPDHRHGTRHLLAQPRRRCHHATTPPNESEAALCLRRDLSGPLGPSERLSRRHRTKSKKFSPQIHTDLHRWFIGPSPPGAKSDGGINPFQAIHTTICANPCVSVAKISSFSLNYPDPARSTLEDQRDAV